MGAEVVPVDERPAGRSRTRSTRRCATGRRASRPPIICSAPSPARIPSRLMVREFQRVIGRRRGRRSSSRRGGCPTRSIACVGGGSNAMGLFADFIDDESVRLIGVEPAGKGLDGERAWRDPAARPARASSTAPKPMCCRTRTGRSTRAGRSRRASIIPRSGPSTPILKDSGRAEYVGATDAEALDAFACWRGPRASSAPSNRPTRSPMR